MQEFTRWLFRENISSVHWLEKTDLEWRGTFEIGNKSFEITFWKNNFDAKRDDWSAQFYELSETGRYSYDNNDQIGLTNFIELFKIIDEALVELFSTVEVKRMMIEPQAVSDRRIEKCKKRREKYDPISSSCRKSDFDQSKFFGYQTLFNYSKLKQMGYELNANKDVLLIKRKEMRGSAVA